VSGNQTEFSIKLASLLVSVPAGLSSGLHLYYLPYFRTSQNALWPLLLHVFILTAGALALSDSTQNPSVALALVLFLSPVLALLTREAVQLRWDYICQAYPADFKALTSPFQVELGTRQLVAQVLAGDKVSKEAVISAFNLATNLLPSQMLCVWEADFFAFGLQDLRVAMLKVTKMQRFPTDFEASYRAFCLAQLLAQEQKRFEELEYLSFWHAFEEAKALDRRSCHLLGAFWSELSSSWPKYAVLSGLARQISGSLRTCVRKNKEALQNYRSKQALTLLGTLLKDILNDSRGNEYLARANITRQSGENHFFSEDGAILIVSGEQKRLGEILFVSEPAKNLLKLNNQAELLGQSITVCIPEPWAKQHLAWLQRFLLFATSHSVQHSTLHFCTAKGFLIETVAQIKVSYLNGKAFILVAFAVREPGREVLLLEEGGVRGHTEAVPWLLGRPAGVYTGADLETLCPGLKLAAAGEVAFYQIGLRRLVVKQYLESYGQAQVCCVQVLTEEEAARLATQLHSHSQLELQPSLSSVDLSPEPSFKKVGFQTRLPVTAKSASFADMEDPALTVKPGVEVKTSINSSVATSHALVSAYSKSDLSRVKSASHRLELALLALMAAVVAVTGASCVLLKSASSSLELSSDLPLVLRRSFYSAKIASEVADFPSGDLAETLQLYAEVFARLQESEQDWRGPLKEYYTEVQVPTWDFWNNKCAMHRRTLMDAMQTYIDHGKSFKVQQKAVDLEYIRRNGLGETFRALNETNALHVAANIEALEAAERTVLVLIWTGQGAVICLFAVIVLPCVLLIARVHAQAWRRLLALKRSTLLKLRNDCHSRLEFQHNREETANRPFEAQASERRVSAFAYHWQGLACKTGAYVLLASAFLLCFWKLLCDPVFHLLLVRPRVVQLLEEQNTLLQTVAYWSQTALAGQEEVCPHLYVSATAELNQQITELRRNLEVTLAGFPGANADFLLDPQPTSDLLTLGIHLAISLLSLEPQCASQNDLLVLKRSIATVQSSLQQGAAQYLKATRALGEERVALALTVSVLFACWSVGLLLAYYVPVVHRFRKQVSEVWKLYRIVPLSELAAAS